MPFYAQLNADRVVIAVTQTAGRLEPDPLIVDLEALQMDLLGCQHHLETGDFRPMPSAAPAPRKVSPLAFRRRFTRQERAAIEWAAVDRPDQPDAQRMQAAELRATLKDQEQATFIDLADPDVEAGVQTLESMGLLQPGRAEQILGAPVQTGELP